MTYNIALTSGGSLLLHSRRDAEELVKQAAQALEAFNKAPLFCAGQRVETNYAQGLTNVPVVILSLDNVSERIRSRVEAERANGTLAYACFYITPNGGHIGWDRETALRLPNAK